MTQEKYDEIKGKLAATLPKLDSSPDEVIIFGEVFNEPPKYDYFILFNKKSKELEIHLAQKSIKGFNDDEDDEKPSYLTHPRCCRLKYMPTFSFHTSYDDRYVIMNDGVLNISTSRGGIISTIQYCTNNQDSAQDALELCKDCLEATGKTQDGIEYKIVTNGKYGYNTDSFFLEGERPNIKDNYNDDFPYDKIVEIQRENKASLVLLHGEPGTGKTTALKALLHDLGEDTSVFYMDANVLSSFSDAAFLDFAMSTLKNNVVIFEDCEKILSDRTNSDNPFLNTLLNLTDGFLAEALKIHFICTFNCNLSKIDKALLRKGRLTLRYEFGKLSKDKVKKILHNDSITSDMTLADIYNKEDNSFGSTKKNIGFIT